MKSILLCALLLNMLSTLIGFSSHMYPLRWRQIPKNLQCIQQNKQSYYATHTIVSNRTRDIVNIYTTYDNRNTLVFYYNGTYSEHLNKSLRLVYDHEILHVKIVSNSYFIRIYNFLKDLKKDI